MVRFWADTELYRPILSGHPIRPRYWLACPSVCLSVQLLFKSKTRTNIKIGVNVSHSRSNRCANLHLRRLVIKFARRRKPPEK